MLRICFDRCMNTLEVSKGHGAKGQIRVGASTSCGKSIKYKSEFRCDYLLNSGSVIDFLKSKNAGNIGKHLRKGFLGIGRSKYSEIQKTFDKYIMSIQQGRRILEGTGMPLSQAKPNENRRDTQIQALNLIKELDVILKKYNQLYGDLGHNRNFQPHFQNLSFALALYYVWGSLWEPYDAMDGHGMSGLPQPKTIGATFELALSNKEGSLTHAIQAIENGKWDQGKPLLDVSLKIRELLTQILPS